MNAFTIMVDAQFEDPNLGLDAIWRAGGAETGLPVRIRRRSPEAIIGAAGNQFDLDQYGHPNNGQRKGNHVRCRHRQLD